MKRYDMSFGQAIEHAPAHPDRTARKATGMLGETVTFQVWPSRAAMARSIRMQERRAPRNDDWRAVVKLRDGEGY